MTQLPLIAASSRKSLIPDDSLSVPKRLRCRPYQVDALAEVQAAAKKDLHRQLVVMATGGGKTIVLAQLPDVLGIRKMLVLAHRQELLTQNAAKIRLANPRLNVQIEQAQNRADGRADVVVGSVQTLGNANGKRLDQWVNAGFECVVVDEAHHTTAPSYLRILQALKAGKPGGPILVGVTATPFRGDGIGLQGVYDKIVYEKNAFGETGKTGLIEDGWLVPIRARKITTQEDMSEVATRLGEYVTSQLADVVNVDTRNSLIISAVEDHAADRRRVLVFAVDVAHVEQLTAQFKKRGHSAEYVTGMTEMVERAHILSRYERGETKILVNCGIATEGYDNVHIDAIVMARPVKSPLLYAQMIGRGTRPVCGGVTEYEDADGAEARRQLIADSKKPDLLVIDIVDNCGRHSPQTASSYFGMREMDMLGEDCLVARRVAERAAAAGVRVSGKDNIETLKRKVELVERGTVKISTMSEAVELFSSICELAPEVAAQSKFNWIPVGADDYKLSIFVTKTTARLCRTHLGTWEYTLMDATSKQIRCEHFLGSEDPPFAGADRLVKRDAKGPTEGGWGQAWKQLSTDAPWQRKPATPKQIETLRRCGVSIIPPDLTMGAASRSLDTIFSRRKAAREARA